MRHNRWFRVLALLLPLVLLAAACGDDDDDDTTAGDDTTETTAADDGGEEDAVTVGLVYDLGGRGDQSFNDSAAAGLDRAKEDFDIGDPEELEPDEGGENREELMRLLADEGTSLIFGVGFLFTDSITAAAPDFPDTRFAIIDGFVEAPNVANLGFAEHEGSFLMGAAAALKSTTGHVGFIGGVEVDLIKKFEAGYMAGAKHVNPDITVDVAYITQPPDFAGFNDPARAKEIATGMYGAGADVVYHAAGGSGGGLFEAAKEQSDASGSQMWAIGVDSDQYLLADASLQPYILTSMLKKVEVAVYDTIERAVNGDDVAGATSYDLESGGVDYATSGGFVDDIADQLEELKAQIIAGDIEVPQA